MKIQKNTIILLSIAFGWFVHSFWWLRNTGKYKNMYLLWMWNGNRSWYIYLLRLLQLMPFTFTEQNKHSSLWFICSYHIIGTQIFIHFCFPFVHYMLYARLTCNVKCSSLIFQFYFEIGQISSFYKVSYGFSLLNKCVLPTVETKHTRVKVSFWWTYVSACNKHK